MPFLTCAASKMYPHIGAILMQTPCGDHENCLLFSLGCWVFFYKILMPANVVDIVDSEDNIMKVEKSFAHLLFYSNPKFAKPFSLQTMDLYYSFAFLTFYN